MEEADGAEGPTFVSPSETVASRVDAHGFYRNVFFGRADFDGPGPQAYVNDLDPDVELAAHFHKVDQYQVFFGSPGATYKHRPIPTVLLHYTDAYSTYGPFGSGPDARLRYATLRAQSSNFGGVMPGAKDQLIRRGGLRNLTAPVAVDSVQRGLPAQTHQILGPHPDGLQAFTVTLAPGGTARLEPPTRTSGRYFCVLSGELAGEGRQLEAGSLGWRDPHSGAVEIKAGPSGCCLLAMHFPWPATPDTLPHPTPE